MRGSAAYQTYLGMSLHFQRKSYDGWKYNFKTKFNEERFKNNKQICYQYAAIESQFSDTIDQVKFYYPAFMGRRGHVHAHEIPTFRTHHRRFLEELSGLRIRLEEKLKSLVANGATIYTLFQADETLPYIYQLFHEGVLTYEEVLMLFTVEPKFFDIQSREPFVFEKFKKEMSFDSKFFRYYIDVPCVRDTVVSAFLRT